MPLIYDSVSYFSEGLANVKVNGKVGFIDKTGRFVIPLLYDNASAFKEGLAIVQINYKNGLVDKLGKIIVPPIYDKVGIFHWLLYYKISRRFD